MIFFGHGPQKMLDIPDNRLDESMNGPAASIKCQTHPSQKTLKTPESAEPWLKLFKSRVTSLQTPPILQTSSLPILQSSFLPNIEDGNFLSPLLRALFF